MAKSGVLSSSIAALLLLVLLVTTSLRVEARADAALSTSAAGNGEPFEAEARVCESQSHRFKGLCFSAKNCGNVCKTEGFHGGKCRGFRRRCFCTRHC